MKNNKYKLTIRPWMSSTATIPSKADWQKMSQLTRLLAMPKTLAASGKTSLYFLVNFQDYVRDWRAVNKNNCCRWEYTLERTVNGRVFSVRYRTDTGARYGQGRIGIYKYLLGQLKAQIQDYRRTRREVFPTNGRVHTAGIRLAPRYNGIRLTPGTFLNLVKTIKRTKISQSKKPVGVDRFVGVELECFTEATRETLMDTFVNAGLHNEVGVGDDGSIRHSDGMHPHEVRVCAKESEIHSVLARVCAVLRECGGKVNSSCGLHVHIDARNGTRRSGDRVFKNLVMVQDLLFRLVPQSRRDNNYCRRQTFTDLTEAMSYGDRYRAINSESYKRFKSIEVRLHSGSINAVKISHWIKLLTSVASAYKINDPIQSIEALVEAVKLPDDTKAYLKKRLAQLDANPADAEAA